MNSPSPVNTPPAGSAPRQTNPLALTSLIAGILGWVLLPLVASIVAIITGHMARAEIRRQPHQWEGDGLAMTGLILGWLSVVMWVVGILVFVLFFGGLLWLSSLNS